MTSLQIVAEDMEGATGRRWGRSGPTIPLRDNDVGWGPRVGRLLISDLSAPAQIRPLGRARAFARAPKRRLPPQPGGHRPAGPAGQPGPPRLSRHHAYVGQLGAGVRARPE